MDLTTGFKSFEAALKSSLVEVTKTAAQIPLEDLNFHRSANPTFSKALDTQKHKLLGITNKLLRIATNETTIPAPKLQGQEGIEDNWRKVVDVVDDLLEKADASLDEFSGVLKRLSPSRQVSAEVPPKQTVRTAKVPMTYGYSNLPKPQLTFQQPVNNYLTTPFKPLLHTKPHAQIPLEQAIEPGENGKYKHPYAFEIEQSQFPESVYTNSPPLLYQPSTDSKPILVDTEEGVVSMLAELKLAKEIAIDLEHHDTHSYIGLVSLMQISTREKDWIVDTLKPWRENLQVLNEVFADPNILKVFHGSTMDMIWLQRDLGLYVVCLFDTFHAAVALEFPKKSLAYLLERFANFHAQKKYQLADWRVRPLPSELIDYARSDTHYLLYVYDNLRNMLLDASTPDNNLITQVLLRSKKEALQTYERPIYDVENGMGPVGWFKPLMQRAVRFDKIQFAVWRALHQWRDEKARALDEGEAYIMTSATLWSLAESMPMNTGDLHHVLRPISSFVSQNAKDITAVIRKAKFDGLTGPSIGDVMLINEKKFGTSTFWNKKPKPAPPQSQRGIGQTLQMLATDGELNASKSTPVPETPDFLVTRSSSSFLWGASIPQSVPPQSTSAVAASSALRSVQPLIAPLPISSSTQSPVPVSQINKQPPTIDVSMINAADSMIAANMQPKDDIFVLRDLNNSKKRKANHEPMTNLLGSDLPTLSTSNSIYSDAAIATSGNPDEPSNLLVQSRHKSMQKRAAKTTKKNARQVPQEQLVDAKPFNYAEAESILYAIPNGTVEGTSSNNGVGAGGAKVMNPFAKALDTGTGAKRLKQGKEQSGRSMTFKS